MNIDLNSGKPNKGVKCSVHHCQYHDGMSYCTAEKVAIGPASAVSCADTICATFKPREGR